MIRVYENLNLAIYFGTLGLFFGIFFRFFGLFLYRILGFFSDFFIFGIFLDFWDFLRDFGTFFRIFVRVYEDFLSFDISLWIIELAWSKTGDELAVRTGRVLERRDPLRLAAAVRLPATLAAVRSGDGSAGGRVRRRRRTGHGEKHSGRLHRQQPRQCAHLRQRRHGRHPLSAALFEMFS